LTQPNLLHPRTDTDPTGRLRADAGRTDTLDLPVVGQRPPNRPKRRSKSAVATTLLAAALAGLVTGAVVAQRSPTGSAASATQSASSGTAEIAPASVVSFDPSGGTGFRQDDAQSWRAQTYRTAEFGNLKSGVGLLIDLGDSREVTSVTLEAATQGLAVELRSADEQSSAVEDYRVVDSDQPAGGASTLSAEGAGAHRYWLVWITRLGPGDGGFTARVGTPVVSGPDAPAS
jgi:eukaryotic-like serine/threonine-protein kinase